MHWNDHRRSTDLDFMMRAEAFDEHLETLKAMLWDIPAAKHQITHDKKTGTPIVLAAQDVGGRIGDIEIVRDALGDTLREALPLPAPQVWEVAMNAEAKEYILAKKFSRMDRRHLERDHYDVLWAAYHKEDREALIKTVMYFLDPETLRRIAIDAQQDPRVLFEEPRKHVLDPKAPDWKEVLGEDGRRWKNSQATRKPAT